MVSCRHLRTVGERGDKDAENVIDLIRNADAAMYYSKQNGGNTFAFYSPEMNAAAVERLMPARQCMTSGVLRSQLFANFTSRVMCSSLGGV